MKKIKVKDYYNLDTLDGLLHEVIDFSYEIENKPAVKACLRGCIYNLLDVWSDERL